MDCRTGIEGEVGRSSWNQKRPRISADKAISPAPPSCYSGQSQSPQVFPSSILWPHPLSVQLLRTDLAASLSYEEFALNPYLNVQSIKEVYVKVSTAAYSAVTSIASSSFVLAQFLPLEAKSIFKESCWRGQSFMQGTHHLCMGTSLGILATWA